MAEAFSTDRVKPYLTGAAEKFRFYELTDAFLEKYGFAEVLSGIPIPFQGLDGGTAGMAGTAKAAAGAAGEDAIAAEQIADNMAFILGVDPAFKYRGPYEVFIVRYYGSDPAGVLAAKGGAAADAGEFETAAVWFRAALAFSPTHKAALYGYSRTLTELYAGSGSEDYIGNLKAEAAGKMELLTQEYPEFAKGWYYLGYMYLNLGLYTKAHLAWKEYLKRSVVKTEREEIEMRMSQLKIPMEIEQGANAVISGRWEEGVSVLEKHSKGKASVWWPLWYYLGLAYRETGKAADAETALRKALRLSPRNTEIMRELIAVYKELGNEEKVSKYERKIELLEKTCL
ncbi:MAG: tetratricopeptide repeat protein [Clostridiales Family XIII bacterium]|jgi:tetratricopeptide (TPR) repeat protein|nr:tetratricopeptide repeat protein [Clostridiales Family XIII bacterium]